VFKQQRLHTICEEGRWPQPGRVATQPAPPPCCWGGPICAPAAGAFAGQVEKGQAAGSLSMPTRPNGCRRTV